MTVWGQVARTGLGGLRRLALGGLVASLVLLAGPAAAADDGQWKITRYDVTIDVDDRGNGDVVIDFDYDFSGRPGRGPTMTIPLRMETDQPGTLRRYHVSDLSAESLTGAPDTLHRDWSDDTLSLRIGAVSRSDITGVHRYVVRYHVLGMINPASERTGGYDALYWNVLGTASTIPVSNASVTVRGVADVVDARCFAGPAGGDAPCSSVTVTDGAAIATQDHLEPGEPFTIDAVWPGETMPWATMYLEDDDRPGDPFGFGTVWTVGLATLIVVGWIGWLLWRLRTRGRDEMFVGLTPGVKPSRPDDATVGPRDRRLPVAVQFQPPSGVRPGEAGTVLDEKADLVDVVATVVDLAVRGFLSITEIPGRRAGAKAIDWRLTRGDAPLRGLATYERILLDGLFHRRDSVLLSALSATFAGTTERVRAQLYRSVVDRKWFAEDPSSVRSGWRVSGGIAMGVGIFGMMGAFWPIPRVDGLALVPIALMVVGLAQILLAPFAPARTARGTAVLTQVLGFKLYLETAEADTLRFEDEEGDVFSRYLPYAIVFGVADRWTALFAGLAEKGQVAEPPAWYEGAAGLTAFWAAPAAFSSAVASFTESSSSALSKPEPSTSGSSGGSSYGGGGGSSGGGGGGGGVGGW